jgi:phosphoribosylamine--glycine ligase
MTENEAEAAVRAAMVEGALGDAGASLVIEDYLTGDEVSVFALCDGMDAVLLGAAQDHKRVGDGDTGPNTGGMGAVSPPTGFGVDAQAAALDVFVRPALAAMVARGTPFRGVLFAGLMLTPDGPKLIEYNVRLGDPEAQVLLPRLRTDLLTAMIAGCDGELGHLTMVQDALACVGVVLASRGYPGVYAKGGVIDGLEIAAAQPHVAVFHAGTDLKNGDVVAASGRVLTVCATGPDIASARASAYAGVAAIEWEDKMFRTDIGLRAQLRAAEASGA